MRSEFCRSILSFHALLSASSFSPLTHCKARTHVSGPRRRENPRPVDSQHSVDSQHCLLLFFLTVCAQLSHDASPLLSSSVQDNRSSYMSAVPSFRSALSRSLASRSLVFCQVWLFSRNAARAHLLLATDARGRGASSLRSAHPSAQGRWIEGHRKNGGHIASLLDGVFKSQLSSTQTRAESSRSDVSDSNDAVI